eukprot:2839433-Amphidinium_carterae.1
MASTQLRNGLLQCSRTFPKNHYDTHANNCESCSPFHEAISGSHLSTYPHEAPQGLSKLDGLCVIGGASAEVLEQWYYCGSVATVRLQLP